jgi:hypothetical protein
MSMISRKIFKTNFGHFLGIFFTANLNFFAIFLENLVKDNKASILSPLPWKSGFFVA